MTLERLPDSPDDREEWKIFDPDVPDHYVVVRALERHPFEPETNWLLFTICSTKDDAPCKEAEIKGRPGLIAWYERTVGYSPDEDVGGKTPIMDLVDQVGSMMLFHFNPHENE